MISFHFESDYRILDLSEYSDWVARIIESEGFTQGDISYIFYTDEKLLELNQEYLKHDTFTDIITFDYCDGKMVSGDIFISTDRVRDNAKAFEVPLGDNRRSSDCAGRLIDPRPVIEMNAPFKRMVGALT